MGFLFYYIADFNVKQLKSGFFFLDLMNKNNQRRGKKKGNKNFNLVPNKQLAVKIEWEGRWEQNKRRFISGVTES